MWPSCPERHARLSARVSREGVAFGHHELARPTRSADVYILSAVPKPRSNGHPVAMVSKNDRNNAKQGVVTKEDILGRSGRRKRFLFEPRISP